MKTILTLLLAFTVLASEAQKHHAIKGDTVINGHRTFKSKLRYFMFVSTFTLDNGCKSESTSFPETYDGYSLNFNDAKALVAAWVSPNKITHFEITTFKEVDKYEHLKHKREEFKCPAPIQIHFFSTDTIKWLSVATDSDLKKHPIYTTIHDTGTRRLLNYHILTFYDPYNWTAKSDTVKCLMYLKAKNRRYLDGWESGYVILPGNCVHSLYSDVTWSGDYIAVAIGPFSDTFLTDSKELIPDHFWVVQISLIK